MQQQVLSLCFYQHGIYIVYRKTAVAALPKLKQLDNEFLTKTDDDSDDDDDNDEGTT